MLNSGNAKTLDLKELTDKFLKLQENIKTASPHTLKAYRLDLTQAYFCHQDSVNTPKEHKQSVFAVVINQAELLSLSRSAQQNWGHLAAATKNRKAATLKSFLKYLFSEGVISQDLSLQIHCPKIPRKIPHFLSVDDILAVLQSYQMDEKNKQIDQAQLLQEKILFLLLYGGGLRISEACNLKWSQCQLNQQVLKILGKGNKERLVALPKTLCLYLLEFKKNTLVNNSLTYIWGEAPLNPRVGYEWIRQRGRRAQLMHPIHPHALRHSFATHLLSSGANLRTLQELLGHESLRATEKYTHLDIHQLARTLEKHHPLSSTNTDKREKSES